jgi:quinol monooxygenase YgiN
MADAAIHRLPEGIGPEQYERVNEKLNAQGDQPTGLIFHAAGQGEDGRWRIIEVWESRADFDRFNEERLTPAIAEVSGVPAEQIPEAEHTWFSVHTRFPE